MNELKAVLWDLDGTLVDSEPYWIRAELELADAHGATWTEEDAYAQVGHPIIHTAAALHERGVPLSPEEIQAHLLERMREQVVTDGLPYRPGARELIESLSEAGVAQALVTMSFGAYVQGVLETATFFDAVRTGDQVTRGKPDPEIYLSAVQALGLTPSDCLGIEDSPSGVGALLGAGVTPLAVPHMVGLEPQQGLVLSESLTEWDAAALQELHRRWQAGEH